MNFKILITLIVAAIWFGGSSWYYTCKIKGFCGNNSTNTSTAVSDNESTSSDESSQTTENKYPLAFKWGDANPITGPDFEAFKQALLSDSIGGKSLTITGQYFAGEEGKQLGLARAKEIRLLLADALDTNRIFVSEKLASSAYSREGQIFESAEFAWNAPEESIIERTGNELTIYFPYNSTQKIDDPAIDNIFKELVTEIQAKDYSVELTGHTDNVGPDDYNTKLGTQRAAAIKALFVQNGLNAQKISVNSQGMKQPVGDNNTEAGRKKNRRVVINIQQ